VVITISDAAVAAAAASESIFILSSKCEEAAKLDTRGVAAAAAGV
jgi:hypothetical protein